MQTETLKKAVQTVIPAVDSNSIVEQISHVIFTDGIISAYNGKIAISTPLEHDLECSVPADLLLKVLKTVKDKEVSIEVEDGLLYVSSNHVKATISTEMEDSSVVEAMKDFEKDIDILYEGKGKKVPENFKEGLNLCKFSTSDKVDDIYNTNCIVVRDDKMQSTDGYRVTIVPLEGGMEDIMIPVSSARELAKIDVVEYVCADNWVHFIDDEDTLFSCRTVDGDFPNLTELLSDFKADVEMELPDELKEVAKELGDISDTQVDMFKIIEVNITGENITCSVSQETVSVTKSVEFPDNEDDVGFYISAPMFHSVMELTNHLSIGDKFAVFTGDNFTHYIRLPEGS